MVERNVIEHEGDGEPSRAPERSGAALRQEPADAATPSKASIAGHPIHPMIIPFPIAFLIALPLADIVFWATGQVFWARTAFYLLVAGLVMGALAALVGLVDFSTLKEVRRHRQSYWHMLSNIGALALAVVNLVVRVGDPVAAILPAGLILSLVTAGLLTVGGWYGGELSYRFRIGVARS